MANNNHRHDVVTFDVPACFKVEGVVGQGAYGAVCKATWNGHNVAIKKIPNYAKSPETARRVLREVEILDCFQYCAQVVACYTRFRPLSGEKDVYIVMDYVSSDLSTALKRGVSMTEDIVRYITCQLLLALRAMHKQNCIHRDLSSRNILLSTSSEAYVCDFGLSRFFDPEEQLSFGVVTQWYRAPEIVTDAAYDTASDIWSVGVLMGEMFLQRHLFAGKPNDPADQLNKIFGVLGTPNPALFRKEGESYANASSNAKNYMETFINKHPLPNRFDNLQFKIVPAESGRLLLKKMLSFDPRERPTADEALKNPYFDSLRDFITGEMELQDGAGQFEPYIAKDAKDLDELVGKLEELVPVYSNDVVNQQMAEALAAMGGDSADAAAAGAASGAGEVPAEVEK